MEIETYKNSSRDMLIGALKNVIMLKDNRNYVYSNAYITIETIDPEILYPCQYYILKDELEKKIELKEAFEKKHIDIFKMSFFCEFKLINECAIRTLLPPIIEESIEEDGRIYPLINDGMHRISLARFQRKKINVIYIRGASEKYYAYPLFNGWKDVKVINDINKDTIKKVHRISDNKKLYRNFDSVFTNCSKPRGLSENK